MPNKKNQFKFNNLPSIRFISDIQIFFQKWIKQVEAFRSVFLLADEREMARRIQIKAGLCTLNTKDFKGQWECPTVTNDVWDKAKKIKEQYFDKVSDNYDDAKDNYETFDWYRLVPVSFFF